MAQILLQGTCGESQNVEHAKHLLEKAAEEGYGEALVFLGVMYQQDNEKAVEKAAKVNIQQDFRRAIRLYSAGERQGIPIAVHNLARMYQFGQGVPPDYDKAMHLFRVASKKGWADSMVNLAGMLLQLSDEPDDREEALALLRDAAGQGKPLAKQMLERLDRGGDLNHLAPTAGKGKGTRSRVNRRR